MAVANLRYVKVFFAHNGPGPYACHFCGEPVTFDDVVVQSSVTTPDQIALVRAAIRRQIDRRREVCREFDKEIARLRDMLPIEERE